MSLINCPQCGSRISSEASFCPHCDSREAPIYVAKSIGNRLEIYKNKVVIKISLSPRNEIFIQSITGIRFKKGNLLSMGHLEIKSKGDTTDLLGLSALQRTVHFKNSSRHKFEEAKNIIEEMVYKHNQESTSSQSNSVTKELQELHDLKEKGIITEEEYSNLKKRIIHPNI